MALHLKFKMDSTMLVAQNCKQICSSPARIRDTQLCSLSCGQSIYSGNLSWLD